MRFSPTLAAISVAGLVFIFAGSIPKGILRPLVGSYIGATTLLLIVLAVAQYDVVISIAIALAVAALFIENRRAILMSVVDTIEKEPVKVVKTVNSAPERHVESEAHIIEEEKMVERPQERPQERPEREPLETVDNDSVAELMIEKGLASLRDFTK